jgi:O-antigen/teichoic acid export membrane protein
VVPPVQRSDPTYDSPANMSGAATPSRTDRTVAGWFFMTFGTGVQGALTIGVILVLSRLLSPEDFGVLAASLLVIQISAIFTQAGIGPALVQQPALRREHIYTGFSLCIGSALVLLLGILVFATPIARALGTEALVPVLRALAWLLPLQALTIVPEFLLRRDLEFRVLARIRVVSFGAGYGAVGITAAALGAGVWALVAANAAQTLLTAVMLIARRPHPMRLALEPLALRELLSFGAGFSIARIGNTLATHGDKFVAMRWLGPAALGLYERAYQLMAMPAVGIGQVLDDVLFPAMAQIQHDRGRMVAAYRRCVSGIALLTIPIGATAFVLAPEIVAVVLGPKWLDAVLPLQVLAFGMMFRTSYKISDSLTRAVGAVYRRAWRQWVYATLVIGAGVVGARWGIAGLAAGVLLALATNFVLMAQLCIRLLGMTWGQFAGTHLPGLRAGVIVGLVAWSAASAMRGVSAPPILVILVVGAAIALALGGLWLATGTWLLGTDGRWLADRMLTVGRRMLRLEPAARRAS